MFCCIICYIKMNKALLFLLVKKILYYSTQYFLMILYNFFSTFNCLGATVETFVFKKISIAQK